MITQIMKHFTLIVILSVCCSISGCDSEDRAANNQNAATFGQVVSFELAAISLEGEFNKWGMVQRGSAILELLLELKDDPLDNPTPSNWSLNIRSLPGPNGRLLSLTFRYLQIIYLNAVQIDQIL
jgi:hypothetical protein